MLILDVKGEKLVPGEIYEASDKELPGKSDGWNFSWESLVLRDKAKSYALRVKNESAVIQGAVHLIEHNGMLIMDLLEVAPGNVGKKKKYDFVAGCLIAFACRESFNVSTSYKGYLTFQSKTQLIELYKVKYRAKLAIGQRMYIDPENGAKLIQEYLHRKNLN